MGRPITHPETYDKYRAGQQYRKAKHELMLNILGQDVNDTPELHGLHNPDIPPYLYRAENRAGETAVKKQKKRIDKERKILNNHYCGDMMLAGIADNILRSPN